MGVKDIKVDVAVGKKHGRFLALRWACETLDDERIPDAFSCCCGHIIRKDIRSS